jgi:hypothetical protein
MLYSGSQVIKKLPSGIALQWLCLCISWCVNFVGIQLMALSNSIIYHLMSVNKFVGLERFSDGNWLLYVLGDDNKV